MVIKTSSILLCILLLAAAPSMAKEYSVGQKDKKFTTKELKIKKGDTVRFTNEDPFFHNIYSLSDTKSFDLGSYPKGQYRSVTFDEEGVVEIECAIHPSMKLKIEVTE